MSKIIYLMPPAHGHVNPTLPLMQELVQRGERIICYNSEEFRSPIEQTGATFCPYAPTEMTSAAFSRLLHNGNLASVTGLILRTTEKLLPSLLDELGHEKPDLVIFDSIALWGKMAATLLDLPAAASISHFIMDETQVSLRDLLSMIRLVLPKVPGILATRRRLIRRYSKGFPLDRPLFPMRGRLNIVFTTRELQPDTPIIDTTFRFVGPSINPQMRNEEFPFDRLGQGPIVYISLGTVHYTHTEFYRTCFKAFAEYQAQFILAVGKQTDMEGLGSVPDNFIVRPHVPQLEVLQRTDVFITHGGMNSVHEGLCYGVPLILIPHQFEQLLNARCVAARGAGTIIDEQVRRKPVTAPRLRQGLDTVLSGSRYGEAARRIQKSLRATGGYRQAADEIQSYLSQL